MDAIKAEQDALAASMADAKDTALVDAQIVHDEIQRIFDEQPLKVRIDWPTDGFPGGGVPGFASGGWGDFGSGRLAMLHGREAIVPLDRPSRIGAALGGGGTSIVINNPMIDSAVGLDRMTRQIERALDRAAKRVRV